MTKTLPGVEAARALMLAAARPLPPESIALAEAAGRTLAAPVRALRDQPPFRSSAMDGYAVRGADILTLPASLRVAGESAAGRGYRGAVQPGEAVRIFTGAPVPEGADWIVIQENTNRDGETVLVSASGEAANIRPQAGDFQAGAELLSPRALLDASALGLAASAGAATLACVRKARVSILATGAELVAPGAAPGPDQIFESVSPAIAALAADWGAAPRRLEPAGDDAAAIQAAVTAALAMTDLFVVIGGASVGDHDLARPAFVGLGAELGVQGVAVRPGKPVWFGVLPGGALVLGLPGNPASAQVCARLFLRPLLDVLHGRDPQAGLQPVLARAGAGLPANGPREHWMRARVSVDRSGRLVATAFGDQDSSLQTVLAGANALLQRAPNAPAAPPGDGVRVLLFGAPG